MKRRSFTLLLIPPATYLASYLYLAFFHHKFWLWNTVVHESGRLTLLETSLYASHFLGHIPTLVVIALLFSTWFKLLSKEGGGWSWNWFESLAFTAVCFAGSVAWFGLQDTLGYVTLSKQSEVRNASGGSYLLHLPSTLSLTILIPLFIAFAQVVVGQRPQWHARHLKTLAAIIAAAIVFAIIVAPSSFLFSLHDPRYLAHSVRELATFPLTYFPIPIAFWLARRAGGEAIDLQAKRGLAILAILSVLLLIYQVTIPLGSGINSLAQHPSFSPGPLPVSYLLASHYFEHILDTLFFTAVCFTLIPPRGVNN